MIGRVVVSLLAVVMVTTAAVQTVALFAAGSLRAPLTEAARSFGGARIEPTFGASGLLRERIAAGAQADVLSARAFAGYLLSPEGQAVLARFGFATP